MKVPPARSVTPEWGCATPQKLWPKANAQLVVGVLARIAAEFAADLFRALPHRDHALACSCDAVLLWIDEINSVIEPMLAEM